MGYIKLISVDASQHSRSRGETNLPSRPTISAPGEERSRLDIYDLIQAEMNQGYSLGYIRSGRDVILFEDVCSDGVTVSFKSPEADWTPAERLRPFIPAGKPRRDHAYLEKLSHERGYRVEITNRLENVPA